MTLVQKIKILNEAWADFSNALCTIEKTIKVTPDVETHLWRIKKAFDAIQIETMKQLDKESIDIEFDKMTKKMKKRKKK